MTSQFPKTFLTLALVVACGFSYKATANEGNTHYSPWKWAIDVAGHFMKAQPTGGKYHGTCDICAKGLYPDEGIMRIGPGKKGYRHRYCDWKFKQQHRKKSKKKKRR